MFLMLVQLLVASLLLARQSGLEIKAFREIDTTKQEIELYLIRYIKHAFSAYEEEDEIITINDIEVTLHYDDITAYASYVLHDKVICFRLEYDDLSECVMSVAYLEDGCSY